MLLVNIVGVVVLAVLLTRKIWQLVRDYRNHVPGSRLTARTVSIFGALVIVPLLLVYLFSLEFLNRGIDSWFRVEVKQGLGDALVLSRSALDLRMREQGRRTEEFAAMVANLPDSSLFSALDNERRVNGALEMLVVGRNGEVLAASIEAREIADQHRRAAGTADAGARQPALCEPRAAGRGRLSHHHGRAHSRGRARWSPALPAGPL